MTKPLTIFRFGRRELAAEHFERHGDVPRGFALSLDQPSTFDTER